MSAVEVIELVPSVCVCVCFKIFNQHIETRYNAGCQQGGHGSKVKVMRSKYIISRLLGGNCKIHGVGVA